MRITWRAAALASALLLVGVLSACNTSDPTVVPSVPEFSVFEPKLGDTATWEEGASVTVSKPEEFQLSESAHEGDPITAMKFTITVNNYSGEPMYAERFLSHMYSGSVVCERLYDSENGVEELEGEIPNGTSLTFAVAYVIPDPNDIMITVSPDGGYEFPRVSFTNS